MPMDLEKILGEVRTAFPELSQEKIEINYRKNPGDGPFTTQITICAPRTYIIEVFTELNAKPELIRGGIAHELAHIIRTHKKSELRIRTYDWLCENFPRLRRRDETEVDLEAARHGYGRQIIELRVYVGDYSREMVDKIMKEVAAIT